MLEDQIGRTAPHIGSHEESTPTTLCVALSKPSPAQLLMGRRLRGMLTTQLTSDWTNFNLGADNSRKARNRNMTADMEFAISLHYPMIQKCGLLLVTNQSCGVVVRLADAPRSYIVDTPVGQVRNRQHLNRVPHQEQTSTFSTADPSRDPVVTWTRSGTAIHQPDRL